MKFSKLIAVSVLAVGAALTSIPAVAQTMDFFAAPRSIVLAPPRILDASAALFTNGPIDISGYLGTAVIDVASITNAGGALTAQVFTASDQTNYTALANYSLIKSTTSYIQTNKTLGIWATNAWLLPGTLTTPSASSGFTTPWLDPTTVPFTNSGAATITAKGIYRIGFRAQDVAGRYLIIVWTPTGSSSNDIVSATLTGIKGGEVSTSN